MALSYAKRRSIRDLRIGTWHAVLTHVYKPSTNDGASCQVSQDSWSEYQLFQAKSQSPRIDTVPTRAVICFKRPATNLVALRNLAKVRQSFRLQLFFPAGLLGKAL